jgi:hypothetical protein
MKVRPSGGRISAAENRITPVDISPNRRTFGDSKKVSLAPTVNFNVRPPLRFELGRFLAREPSGLHFDRKGPQRVERHPSSRCRATSVVDHLRRRAGFPRRTRRPQSSARPLRRRHARPATMHTRRPAERIRKRSLSWLTGGCRSLKLAAPAALRSGWSFCSPSAIKSEHAKIPSRRVIRRPWIESCA